MGTNGPVRGMGDETGKEVGEDEQINGTKTKGTERDSDGEDGGGTVRNESI